MAQEVREFLRRSPLENAAESVDSVRISSGEMGWKARTSWVAVLWPRLLARTIHGARRQRVQVRVETRKAIESRGDGVPPPLRSSIELDAGLACSCAC